MQVPNHIHTPAGYDRDTGGRNVLLSTHFWYFGADSKPIPKNLHHLIYQGRGHVLRDTRPGDEDRLEKWLSKWDGGKLGDPIKPPDDPPGCEPQPATRARC